MKIIIAGSTEFTNYPAFKATMDKLTRGCENWVVVSGHARGADQLGERWATERGGAAELYPADWAQFGRSAGPRRNQQIANACGAGDWLVTFWDGVSAGTADMIRRATARGAAGAGLRLRRPTAGRASRTIKPAIKNNGATVSALRRLRLRCAPLPLSPSPLLSLFLLPYFVNEPKNLTERSPQATAHHSGGKSARAGARQIKNDEALWMQAGLISI